MIFQIRLKKTPSIFESYTLQILQNLEFSYMQNSYCDHRNFDSVNQPLPVGIVGEIFAVLQLP
jgi:hypothetical protein